MNDTERVHALEHLNLVFYANLRLCGCGNPDSVWLLIWGLLQLTPYYEEDRAEQVRELIGMEGARHIILSAMDEAGLISHASVIDWAGITDKGRWVLHVIDQLGGPIGLHRQVDEHGYPHTYDVIHGSRADAECIADCWAIPSTEAEAASA